MKVTTTINIINPSNEMSIFWEKFWYIIKIHPVFAIKVMGKNKPRNTWWIILLPDLLSDEVVNASKKNII